MPHSQSLILRLSEGSFLVDAFDFWEVPFFNGYRQELDELEGRRVLPLGEGLSAYQRLASHLGLPSLLLRSWFHLNSNPKRLR